MPELFTGWVLDSELGRMVYVRNGVLTQSYISDSLLGGKNTPSDPKWLRDARREYLRHKRTEDAKERL